MNAVRVAVAVVVMVSGCRSGDAWQREPVGPLGPTLKIVNESSLAYRVTVSPGTVVQMHPGQTQCVRVGIYNEARTMEVFALASSTPHYTPLENLMTSPGWVLEIGQRPKYDVLSLRPAKPCKT